MWAWKRICWQMFQKANGGFRVHFFNSPTVLGVHYFNCLFQPLSGIITWIIFLLGSCVWQLPPSVSPRGSISTFTMTLSSGHASRFTSSETSFVSSVGEKWSALADQGDCWVWYRATGFGDGRYQDFEIDKHPLIYQDVWFHKAISFNPSWNGATSAQALMLGHKHHRGVVPRPTCDSPP